MIKFINTNIGYKSSNSDLLLIKDMNISAEKSNNIALIGINGSGKSTLLKTLAGLIQPISGDIYIKDKKLKEHLQSDPAKRMSFVSSEIIRTRYLKVIDLIKLGRFPHQKMSQKLSDEDIKKVETAIELTNVEHLRDKNIDEISDGERQKVMTARALAQDTDIILMDEPTSFLDINNKFSVFNILNKISKEQEKTVIFSTHDLNLALKYADKVWLIKDKNIFEGAPEDLIINGFLNNIYNNENIKFNYSSGEFTVKFPLIYPINLKNETNDEKIMLMTGNALYRKGYFISEKEEKVKITISKNKTWKIQINEKEHIVNTVYNLLNILERKNY